MKFEPTIKALEKVFGEDTDLLLFYVSWLKNGMKAGKAYKELHPDVTDFSANELGSRMLKKVDKEAIAGAYGLNTEKYFEQLMAGLNAMKRDQFSGEMSEDHRVRKDYHDKLGKLIGLETDSAKTQVNVGVQINNTPLTDEDKLEYSIRICNQFSDKIESVGGKLRMK